MHQQPGRGLHPEDRPQRDADRQLQPRAAGLFLAHCCCQVVGVAAAAAAAVAAAAADDARSPGSCFFCGSADVRPGS